MPEHGLKELRRKGDLCSDVKSKSKREELHPTLVGFQRV
jgi:hypothetical protein